ncbi:Uncharacterised protein [Cedecea neteri]|uniref:Uncharacterized protein n=1 Tax=Cedecea neteri TaxID=158822 RepID=A0A2X2T8L8_9ENTR|nr:Uncharacterised protein [Cedecea neteri]
MLLDHVLPERILTIQHTRYTRLNQQAQRANPLLALKDKVAEIALTQQRQIVIKCHFFRQNLDVLRAKQSAASQLYFSNVGFVVRGVTHWHNNAHRVAKLLVNGFEGINMPVTAIAGVSYQQR